MKRLTAEESIRRVLAYQDGDIKLCVGEIGVQSRIMFSYKGKSDISIARRLYEMEKKGLVKSQTRPDCNYKEWELVEQLGNNGSPLPLPVNEDGREER